jgi:uncharacterized integral membrane protein
VIRRHERIRHEEANVMTRRPERPPVHAQRRISPRQIVALVVIALTLLFVVQNRDTVQIGRRSRRLLIAA